MSRPSDLVQGTLDLLLLKIVALEPLNGWAISQRLKQVSGDVPAGKRWVALPRAAQAGTGGVDRRRMEGEREQPAG